ncbi:unnamed protein product [Sphagnum troendelagicum]|uniref:Uncharacterized protein n=1 Tax=Sphagnum troendelagicum TaxID=128251 RepID=A0ABP0UD19_9BRYO
MPLGRKKNWFAKFGRKNHKQAAMKKNAEIPCLLLLHLQFQYGCKDSEKQCWNSSCFCITAIILMFMYHSRTHCPRSWNLGLVSKFWGGDKCTLPLGCSNQNIFICKQEDHI